MPRKQLTTSVQLPLPLLQASMHPEAAKEAKRLKLSAEQTLYFWLGWQNRAEVAPVAHALGFSASPAAEMPAVTPQPAAPAPAAPALVQLPQPEDNAALTRDPNNLKHIPVQPPAPAPQAAPAAGATVPAGETEAERRVFAFIQAAADPAKLESAMDVGRQMLQRWKAGKFLGGLPSSWKATLKRQLAEVELSHTDVSAFRDPVDAADVPDADEEEVGIL